MIDEKALRSIEKLHEMKANGILSDTEFEEAKAKLLSGQQPRLTSAPPIREPVTEPAEDDYLAWVLLPLRRYAQFTGRSCRKEFWLFLLAANIATLVFLILGVMIGFQAATALWLLGLLAIAVPYVAVQVRRLHDQGRTGWIALANLIPYIGPFVVLAFMLIEGEQGDNAYGPDPKR
ncbi:DUF805 domain-containing protein [Altererythrobacter arenosus]|uniref:DUF805 domain-containing protein n=1 Tax=Altererythrobacter arenosus TaxID=3032592 RepID=A0ABY8FPW3_9SPHN|nr:DUF805 domain-containing protein [Altererythrobacter sp. CAU 1644]WFL76145.1 DUF805 domain-containing protein [Altererythrobacter sp. CAU 1644]